MAIDARFSGECSVCGMRYGAGSQITKMPIGKLHWAHKACAKMRVDGSGLGRVTVLPDTTTSQYWDDRVGRVEDRTGKAQRGRYGNRTPTGNRCKKR